MELLPGQGNDDATLTICGNRITRFQLYAAAAAVAEQVAGADAAAVHATADLSTVIAIIGCLQADVPAVPIPPDSGPRERDHLLRDSGADCWFGDRPDDLPSALPSVIIDRSRQSTPPAEPDPDSTALIMYTSGTTGAPKGALISRRALAAELDALAAAWQWSPEDVLVQGLPLFHVHGLVLGLLGPLRVGGSLIHTGRPRPELYAAAAEAGGTMFFGVPTVWSRIAADPASARALSSARLLVSGSAGLPSTVFRDVRELAGQGPIERYGMTETLITLAARVDEERRPGWVGRPIDGVRARIVDDHEAPVPADGETIGDLQIRGATLFDGYLGRPEATAESFTADGWFRTGDVAAVDAEDHHRIVGRAEQDLIKSGGYRVGAGEIEAVLLDYPGIEEVAVVGVPDDDLGQRIVAYVVGDQVDEQHVINWVAGQLSVHKRPREIRRTASLPRNAMGKIQKSQLH
ncbi:AMP-binding protein [Microlunatus elymi]|uniref:AMP-binding protein n=1 Tax=Microlunatus elymi TaxID=2596828 RepID=A0A516Q1S3_9ACTN|nr:AMP-binding protein [Microlunatus elymi]QDP97380.1 AMP-binding protein [Microlunatus elymi]